MNTLPTHIVPDIEAWKNVIPSLVQAAQNRKIWFLYGSLGAGKTSLVKALLPFLGSEDTATSPSFPIIQMYNCPALPESYENKTLYHMDLFRIEQVEELDAIGIYEILDSGSLCIIEWPQLIESAYGVDAFSIQIETHCSGRKLILL